MLRGQSVYCILPHSLGRQSLHPYINNLVSHGTQDHQWWWSSFLSSGGAAIYVLLYSTYYFFAKLHIAGLVPSLLYFGYSLLMAFAFFIFSGIDHCHTVPSPLTPDPGTIGFVVSFGFVKTIYSAVKLD